MAKPKQGVRCAVKVCRREKGEGPTIKLFGLPVIPQVDDGALVAIAKKRRDVWLKKISHNNPLNLREIYICNQHFYTGKPSRILDYDHPDWAPSMNLNDDPLTPSRKEALKDKLLKHKNRKKREKMNDKQTNKRGMDSQNSPRKKAKMDMPGKSSQLQSNTADQELTECDEDDSIASTEQDLEEESCSVTDGSTHPVNWENNSAISLSNGCNDSDTVSEGNSKSSITPSHHERNSSEKAKQRSRRTAKKKNNDTLANKEPCWTILDNLGRNGKPYLFDGFGHKFGLLKKTDESVKWRCTFRPSHNECPGIVYQMGDKFVVTSEHTCKPKPNLKLNLLLHDKAKQIAKEDKFESAVNLLRPLLDDPALLDDPSAPGPNLRHVAWTLYTTRKKLRPRNPKDLFFTVDQDHIPEGFLRADVVADHSEKHRERHLIFCAEKQLKFLKSAKCWFLDRTCKLIKTPFVELISIHGAYSISPKKDLRQAPLLYVFMSSRKAKDYSIVFEKIVEMLGHEHCVEEIVFNFRKSVLQALEQVLPSVYLYGCPFQWSQTVLRKFKSLGLIPLYDKCENVQKLCWRVLALHLLPGEEIPKAFHSLQAKARKMTLSEKNNRLLLQFFKYVEETWIQNSLWTPDRWSVFMQPVMRPNADAWHNHLIASLRGHNLETEAIDFYNLVLALYNRLNSEWPKGELGFLSQKQQTAILKKQTVKCLSFCLYKYWDSYDEEDINAIDLLKLCAAVYIKNCNFDFVYEGETNVNV